MPVVTTVRIDRTKLRAARIEAGLNQTELAKAVQVTPQWISALETGVKDRISAARLTRICRALKVTRSELKASPRSDTGRDRTHYAGDDCVPVHTEGGVKA